jgi:hypothetical protein
MMGSGARIQPARSPGQINLLSDPTVSTGASGAHAAIGGGAVPSSTRSAIVRSSITGVPNVVASAPTARSASIAPKSGIFHHGGVAALNIERGTQRYRLRRAVRDEHLPSTGLEAKFRVVVGDGLAKAQANG